MTTSTRSTQSNTFIVRIVRIEHGTWQGQVSHAKTGQTLIFQSALQMMRFMDSCAGSVPSHEVTPPEVGQLRTVGRSSE